MWSENKKKVVILFLQINCSKPTHRLELFYWNLILIFNSLLLMDLQKKNYQSVPVFYVLSFSSFANFCNLLHSSHYLRNMLMKQQILSTYLLYNKRLLRINLSEEEKKDNFCPRKESFNSLFFAIATNCQNSTWYNDRKNKMKGKINKVVAIALSK